MFNFGDDFFKMVEFVTAVLRMFARMFGTEEDKRSDDKIHGNHAHELNTIIKDVSPNSDNRK